MSRAIGILLFDDVEELDFAGPWEVLAACGKHGDRALTVAKQAGRIRCANGLVVEAQYGFADCPPLDVLVVPGGHGRHAAAEDPETLEWVRRTAAGAEWITSVCTGAFVLHAAGLLARKRATTYWRALDELAAKGDVVVAGDQRWVQDGTVVTAAGVSAGIDMALWLLGRLYGDAFGRDVQRDIQYDPKPPYPKIG